MSYDGKPKEMKKWHDKVEVRITQTFRQLNIRRLIDIIGYDPSIYFKGEMSYENIRRIRKGKTMENTMMNLTGPLRSISKLANPVSPDSIKKEKLGRIEEAFRNENMSQNLNQVA